MLNLVRYFSTLRHLKLIQIYSQIIFRFRKRRVAKRKKIYVPPLRKHSGPLCAFILKKDKLIDANTVECLNQTVNISKSTIWHQVSTSRLWLYHLHYFNYLHHNNNDDHLLLRWIIENPYARSTGWEAYPTSLRIVNWIKWLLFTGKRHTAILESLVEQITYLSSHLEFHILANHLLANAKALIFAGFYFAENKWLKRGFKLFEKELGEQILADGGHFELSPMYHAIVLEDLLDVINLCQIYQHQYPDYFETLIRKMFAWLEVMCHPDGEFAFFNDTAQNVAATLGELKDYQQRLFTHHQDKQNINIFQAHHQYLPHSGYCRINHQNSVLIADVAAIGASYQPGHAHADTLSFELSIGKKRLLVNSGTSTYNDNIKRLLERSTLAHNTLVINDRNSSDVWKSFRVGRRALVREVELQHKTLRASHNGYAHKQSLIHTRLWQFADDLLTIQDKISGMGLHKLTLYFHLHPDIQIDVVDEKNFQLTHKHEQVVIAELTTEKNAKIIASTYHPGFNITLPNQTILIEMMERAPITITTQIRII